MSHDLVPARRANPDRTPVPGDVPAGPAATSAPRGDVPAVELSFPDLPQLELDQLLLQLVDRAQEVIGTQGRLRGLLRANQLITGELALPAVLRRIVAAARELVGARYAALGVLAPTGGLAEFIHVGMPDEAVQRIGHLPQGKGLLGALIDDPDPIRLRHIADDGRSSGFPPGHPPMDTFLGVPIRIRGEVFGNVYLAESTRGEFSAEDEELLTALAATAAMAIDNARLYESARARGEWLQASAAITRQLLALGGDDAQHPLRLIAERARDMADADLVVVLRPRQQPDADQLAVEVAVGAVADVLTGERLPLHGSLAGRVFSTGEPARVPRLEDPLGLLTLLSGVADIGPVMALPLLGTHRAHGVLCVARLGGRPAFTEAELDMAGSFANHAAVAIELAEARAQQERALVLDDRERIAADLHDHVVQRLFAAGLSLQTVAGTMGRGRMADRLAGTIHDLDDTIRQIRTTIFQLQQEPRAAEPGVRGRLLDVVTDSSRALGFEPGLRFSGLLENAIPPDLVEDLLAVLREALTNVARHAQACWAEVKVDATGDRLLLCVADDGCGIGRTTHASGLVNMRRRAENRGGDFSVEPRQPSGTRLIWSVPTG